MRMKLFKAPPAGFSEETWQWVGSLHGRNQPNGGRTIDSLWMTDADAGPARFVLTKRIRTRGEQGWKTAGYKELTRAEARAWIDRLRE